MFAGFSGADDFGVGNEGWGDDPYTDLLLSAVADSGVEECLQGFDPTIFLEDPFVTMGAYCDSKDEKKFKNALDAFETCSDFNLKDVIETFASAILGLVLNCGSYFLKISDTMDMMMATGNGNLDLPIVPDNCVDALLGDNPFGNMMLASNEFPKRELGCFHDLADTLPLCTLKEWPVPIVGNWLKSISCIIGSMDTMVQPMVDMMTLSDLEQLSICLPADISEQNCQSVLDSCGQQETIISMYLPAPFNAAPLSDLFQDAAQNAGADKPRFESTLKRYEEYRQSCTSAEDRAIWERVPSKSVSTSDLLGIQKAGSASSKFLPGFFTGALLACVGFFLFLKKKGGSSNPHNHIELNSLELSTENQFT